jgi:hypothetical protein
MKLLSDAESGTKCYVRAALLPEARGRKDKFKSSFVAANANPRFMHTFVFKNIQQSEWII